jgi:hypothetical protein
METWKPGSNAFTRQMVNVKPLDALYDEWTGYYDQILFINSSSQLISALRV